MIDQNVPNPFAKNPSFHTHKVFAAIGLILIGIIIIAGGIWYFVQSAEDKAGTIDTATTKVSTSSAKASAEICTQNSPVLSRITSILKSDTGQNVTLEIPNDTNKLSAEGEITWLRAKGEPYVSYSGKNLAYAKLQGDIASLNTEIKNDLTKLLTSYGFEQNSLNTGKFKYGVGDSAVFVYELDYDKAETNSQTAIFKVTFSEQSDNFSIRCATKTPLIDSLYTEILKSGVLGTLETNSLIEIWESNSESVNLAISSIDPHNIGGHSVWLTKSSGSWKKVAEGQNTPDCSVLEAANIGSGIDCADPSVTTNNGVRKTK